MLIKLTACLPREQAQTVPVELCKVDSEKEKICLVFLSDSTMSGGKNNQKSPFFQGARDIKMSRFRSVFRFGY